MWGGGVWNRKTQECRRLSCRGCLFFHEHTAPTLTCCHPQQSSDNKNEFLEVFYNHYMGWLVQPFASADLAVQSAGGVSWEPVATAERPPPPPPPPASQAVPATVPADAAEDQKENTPTNGGMCCAALAWCGVAPFEFRLFSVVCPCPQ